MGRILQQIHNRSRREYGYDAAGQLTHIQNREDQTQYRYDPIGRLIAAVTPDFSETFAFDPANNRLDLSGNKQDHTDQANSQEKPSLNKVWGNLLKEYAGVHYDYDQRGNLIRKTRKGETTDYHWNGYNQLIKIENRNGSTEYRYDPLGRRTAKIRNGETTVYHWQEDTLAIESTNGQNTHYLFEPGTFEPLAQFQTTSPIGIEREDKPAEPYSYDPETDPLLKIPPEPQGQSQAQPELVYYQLDHLGTPIAAHNAKGEAVWTAEYEAWGRIRNETVSDGLKANIPFRFQGQYYDEESGLHYNRFRYYDPEIGRFVSQDPIGLMGGMNLFEYASNPIIWVDPLGLSPRREVKNETTGIACSLSGLRKPDARSLPLIKQGTLQWTQAVNSIKVGGNTNFRVENLEDAKLLLAQGRGNIIKMPRYTKAKYVKGYEVHPSESTTRGAPHNNTEHLKWKDYSQKAKAQGNCGHGHIFFNGNGSIPALRKGE